MTALGQMLLLAAFVTSGWAAFACLAARRRDGCRLWQSGILSGIAAVAALSAVSAILVWALLTRDFHFKYVAQYCSENLPAGYALSAFWVGQAGSLLLWAWMLGLLALAFLLSRGPKASELRRPAFGVLMAYQCFLVAIMVFGADPMEPSLAAPRDGAGLNPLLQHPAMLIHPPIVFLGYAGWAVPFALALAALVTGKLDAGWVRLCRPWALFAWLVLGCGILLGADWAYEELGWGGYWGWDPVENGSLMPWLVGTALIHVAMVYQYRRALKKTTLVLAIATFGLCNFAAFLTRSGVFSSLHAFSESPIGWMFLGGMLLLLVAGVVLIAGRRELLAAETATSSLWTRDAIVAISTVALLLLAGVTLVGTLWIPLSDMFVGRKVMLGIAFYNKVLIPTGLLLLVAVAITPLLNWGRPPAPRQRLGLKIAALAAATAVAAALTMGLRHPVALTVAGASALTVTALVGAVVIDARLQCPAKPWRGLWQAIRIRRPLYAGFLIHLGLVCLAIGVTGSSLGTQRQEFTLRKGETVAWAGRTVRHAGLIQERRGEKHVVEVQLEVTRADGSSCTLQPARHLHGLQGQWTTEVAIDSTWYGDFYTILHHGEIDDGVLLTFVDNPLMRWLWLSGWIAVAGVAIRLWPARNKRPDKGPDCAAVPAPHEALRSGRKSTASAAKTAIRQGASDG